MKLFYDSTTNKYKANSRLLESVPNVFKRGSLIDTDGVLSGFSSANYAVIPYEFSPGTNTWEIVIKIKGNSFSASGQTLFIGLYNLENDLSDAGLAIGCNKNSRYHYVTFTLKDTQSSYKIAPTVDGLTTTSSSTNTNYWFKYTFNGTSYRLSRSTDGSTFTSLKAVPYSSKYLSSYYKYFVLGVTYDSTSSNYIALDGSIDLAECYIKINGGLWWSGIKDDIEYKGFKSYEKGQYYGN